MKTHVSLIALISMMVSVAQPAWSMGEEEEEELAVASCSIKEEKKLGEKVGDKRKRPKSGQEKEGDSGGHRPKKRGAPSENAGTPGKEEKLLERQKQFVERAKKFSLPQVENAISCLETDYNKWEMLKVTNFGVYQIADYDKQQKKFAVKIQLLNEIKESMTFSLGDFPEELILYIWEFLDQKSKYNLGRSSHYYYSLLQADKTMTLWPEKLFAFLEKRKKGFDAEAMKSFLDKLSQQDQKSCQLMIKFLEEERFNLRLRTPLVFKEKSGRYERTWHYSYRILDTKISQYGCLLPLNQSLSTMIFGCKHRLMRFDEMSFWDHIKGRRKLADNPVLHYSAASLILKNAPRKRVKERARLFIQQMDGWRNSDKDEEQCAYQRLNERQKLKLTFSNLYGANTTNWQLRQPQLDAFWGRINTLIEKSTSENYTPHELTKNFHLVTRFVAHSYESNFSQKELEQLARIDEAAHKALPNSWVPTDIYLWSLYNPDNQDQRSKKLMEARTDFADFYLRRALEKEYDLESTSQLIPSLTAYFHMRTNSQKLDCPAVWENLVTNHSAMAEVKSHLSWLYKQGVGVSIDSMESQRWLDKAIHDLYTARDFKNAFRLCKRAAYEGNHAQENSLGYMFEKGQGIEQNFEQASFWYQKAVKGGNVFGLCNLARCYKKGRGVERDPEKASELYQRVDPQVLLRWKSIREKDK